MSSRILSAVPALVSRRSVLALAAVTALATATSICTARAGSFTPAALGTAQKAGKLILVHVSAPWCPTCRAQKPIVEDLTGKAKFKDFVVLDIDFDSQKDVLRTLNVRAQSTLIVYKGASEIGRSVGDTNPASIEALLAAAL